MDSGACKGECACSPATCLDGVPVRTGRGEEGVGRAMGLFVGKGDWLYDNIAARGGCQVAVPVRASHRTGTLGAPIQGGREGGDTFVALAGRDAHPYGEGRQKEVTMDRERVYGVDFSGARDAGRRIWLAEGRVGGGRLRVESCYPAEELPGSGRAQGPRLGISTSHSVQSVQSPFDKPPIL